jgi:DNA-directed RNA polymerase subunit H (RpoH/RPB5)
MTIKENIAKSFQTISEMLMDRKFLNEEEQGVLSSFRDYELNAFSNKHIFNLDIGHRLRIVYYMTKFKMADFKSYVEDADFDLYILVVGDKLTTNNLKSIQEFERKSNINLSIQIFEVKELLFNITKHVLVPKHEVITDENIINGIVEQYNIRSRLHLPLILKTDPIAKYYGIKPGNIVKVTRISPSSGEYVVYRCCV